MWPFKKIKEESIREKRIKDLKSCFHCGVKYPLFDEIYYDEISDSYSFKILTPEKKVFNANINYYSLWEINDEHLENKIKEFEQSILEKEEFEKILSSKENLKAFIKEIINEN